VLKALAQLPYDAEPYGDAQEVRGSASRGETLSMSFSLLSPSSDSEIEVDISPLDGPGGRKLDTEISVVHRWLQSGVGILQSASMEVGELLLKDDSVKMHDGYVRRCSSPMHIHASRSRYRPPDVRLTGAVRSRMVSGRNLQFWISVSVPRNSGAGTYTGAAVVRSARTVVLELPVVVEVLPIMLEEPWQDLMIWHRGTLNCHHPQHYVSPPVFESQLDDIYATGFRSISLWETDRHLLQKAIDMAIDAGFSRNVVLDGHSEKLWSQVDFKNLTPIAYVSDEADGASKHSMANHTARFRAARAHGAKTMASVLHWRTRRSFGLPSDQNAEPDVVSVYAPTNLTSLELNEAKANSGGRTYFYWHAHMEKPLVHRLMSGLFLWRSGADGISPYCYQHLPGVPFSPFDDFDAWDPVAHNSADGRLFRDHMATYPARRGVIPTVQWKGMADGLTDLRYLVTRDSALSRAEQSESAEMRAKASAIRARGLKLASWIPWLDLDLVSESNPLPCAGISAGDFHEMRETVARDIIALS
jgi:hypothetical protein